MSKPRDRLTTCHSIFTRVGQVEDSPALSDVHRAPPSTHADILSDRRPRTRLELEILLDRYSGRRKALVSMTPDEVDLFQLSDDAQRYRWLMKRLWEEEE